MRGWGSCGVLLEHTVVRWLAELVGFPGDGLLTSGASIATIIAVAAARQAGARRDGWDPREDGLWGRPPMVVYVSAEGHSCLRKAVELLGLGARGLRVVPVDSGFRMDVTALRRAIEEDRRDGLRPLCVAASAGTVNTGAIDPLSAIADLTDEYGLWFHVDGAYGALGAVVEPALFAGLERADSLVLDPHKWLGVPVDCGCVLLRDRSTARDAFSLVPAYLRDEGAGDFGWFSEYGPEQTRPLRALKAWATIAHLGADGVARLVAGTSRMAHKLAEMIDEADDFERLAPVTTSVVAFRYRPNGTTDLDALNRAIPAAVQRRGRAFRRGPASATSRLCAPACSVRPRQAPTWAYS
ncbi:pyridoxal phosphate-dependent decarboxylase family protein [Luedemannella flava]